MQAAIDRVLRTFSFRQPEALDQPETETDAQARALAARLLGNYTAHVSRREMRPI